MLSIVVYGRNDSHGYNLHKRAALSFNCLARVLDDDDDEIVFVDYNTPPEMPTFVEAIRDTLTDEAIRRLRVIRVPASVHAERFAARTHLPALEPVARNAGLRRTNPSNRWILSTNTDMLLLPKRATSLSDVVADLDDGYYALPRFELPEALWELLDRRDPERALACVGDWGTSLYLDEIVRSHRWMGFDAPGDFQLVPRAQLFAMDGFDEHMLLGWHVDSNLSRRLSLVYGEPGDLRSELRGYHCNHTRVLGGYHTQARIENDAEKFVFAVNRADIPMQRDCWGLPDVDLEEIDLGSSSTTRLPAALRALLPRPDGEPVPVDAHSASAVFHYRARHVLPYLASALAVLPANATIAYVGANPELMELLAPLLPAMGFTEALLIVDESQDRGGSGSIADHRHKAERTPDVDVVIFDFGLPPTRAETPEPMLLSDWPVDARNALGRVATRLDELVRIDTGDTPEARPDRSYLAVNAAYNLVEPFVATRIAGAGSQFNSRVRQGIAIEPPSGREAEEQSDLLQWSIGYGARRRPEPHYRLGALIDLREVDNDKHLAGAWSWFEPEGTWTEGEHAAVVLEVEPDELASCDEFVFALTVSDFHVPRGRSGFAVDVIANGAWLERWDFRVDSPGLQTRHCIVDGSLVAHDEWLLLELHVHDPRSPLQDGTGPDPRPLGLRVVGLQFAPAPPGWALGERLSTCAPAPPSPVLWKGWSLPEPTGTWTDGNEVVIRVPRVDAPAETVELVLDISDVHLHGEDPRQIVEVAVDGKPSLCWWFTSPLDQYRSITLPVTGAWTTVALSLPGAVSPRSLGVSDDERRLGLRLSALRILESPLRTPGDGPPERAWRGRRLRRRRTT